MDSLFSSTLDTVAPLCIRMIMEKSPTLWCNEHTKESSPENEAQLEENKTGVILYCLAGDCPILQKKKEKNMTQGIYSIQ